MGTSGAYTGSGTREGRALRDSVRRMLEALPPTENPNRRPDEPERADPADRDRPQQDRSGPDADDHGPTDRPERDPRQRPADDGDPAEADPARQPTLDPALLAQVLPLLSARRSGAGGADGSGGGSGTAGGSGGAGGGSRTGGGPRRSTAGTAGTAGRAAAAATAYRVGDTETLERLGLDYAELRALGDDIEVARRIVDIACGRPDSTISDHEQRLVAADVAEWVLAHGERPPSPESIVRQIIATVVSETLLVEAGNVINNHDQGMVAEQDLRDYAEGWAARADLSVDGATEGEIGRAVETGLADLRQIVLGEH
jgi:hypothetical protein